jgi:chemotaxis protein CheD
MPAAWTTSCERTPEASRLPGIYLHPGQLWVSDEPCSVTTILGSCVAVGLWDPASQVGGLCHFLLPQWSGNGTASARFGNVAVERLVGGVCAKGGRRERLQAKIFGGACVIAALNGGIHLGQRNVELARQLVAQAAIPVMAEDAMGTRGRKLIFHTHDGAAWVRLLAGDPSWK